MSTRLARTITAAAATVLLAAPAGARAEGVDQTCVLVLTKFDAATVNIAYPDDSAQYWSGVYANVPGTRVRITGRFPHGRYMSFHVYDPAQRPLDSLTDVEIEPHPGSSNPFRAGADRTVAERNYTVFIEPGERPADPAPNTLYTGTGQNGAPNPVGTFVYRVYVPDRGLDETGGVGLPTATIEPSSSTATPAPSSCSSLSKPPVNGVNELWANAAQPVDVPITGGTNPPTWRKFVNLLSAAAFTAIGSPNPGGVDLDTLGGEGGFLSNHDNAYVFAPISRAWGQVLETRFRAPTFADTREHAGTMPGGELRYWSICQNDPPTQRMIACLNDDRVVIGDDGFVTLVVSTPGMRPPSATRECGVNWLPWGLSQRGSLLYRHMLPAPDFAHSIQAAAVDREQATMGEYLPASRYYADARKYEDAVGCAR